ncbi:hypothetical protein LEMLEM_LOCUS23537, partial [Lemmus lemmus]
HAHFVSLVLRPRSVAGSHASSPKLLSSRLLHPTLPDFLSSVLLNSFHWILLFGEGGKIDIQLCQHHLLNMFIAALFVIARTWKQPRSPSIEEW